MNVPEFVNGIDIETKSTHKNAWVLSIGCALVEVKTLKLVKSFHIAIDSNCQLQLALKRHVSEGTIVWWGKRQSKPEETYLPSDLAYDLTWNGVASTEEALRAFLRYMCELDMDGQRVLHMFKGPEFDHAILSTLLEDFDMGDFPCRIRAVDSIRTIERAYLLDGNPEVLPEEYAHLLPATGIVPHYALSDAVSEAYLGAKYYQTKLRG